jgi:hypothetical protein
MRTTGLAKDESSQESERQNRVGKDKSGEDNPDSSGVRGNTHYCWRK